jgi:suppressor of G2 allele of SKP1
MSALTLAEKGIALVKEKKWDEAIPLLSSAIKQSKSPGWLLARAHALQQTKQLERALADAELGYLKALERNQKQSPMQMATAQYRRAVILYKMGRFADSDACALWSMQLVEGKNFFREADDVATNVDEEGLYKAKVGDSSWRTSMPQKSQDGSQTGSNPLSPDKNASEWARGFVWRQQALAAMEKLSKNDPGRKITVSRVPKTPNIDPDADISEKPKPAAATTAPVNEKVPEKAEPPKQITKQKLRIDFYQSSTKLHLTIYVKNVDKEKVDVSLGENSVRIFASLHQIASRC